MKNSVKKFLTILAVLALSFAFVACVGDPPPSGSDADPDGSGAQETVYHIYLDPNDAVSFDPYAQVDPDVIEVKYGESFTLPTPTRYGYIFEHWIEIQLGDKFESGVFTLNVDVGLRATWRKDDSSDRWFTPDI